MPRGASKRELRAALRDLAAKQGTMALNDELKRQVADLELRESHLLGWITILLVIILSILLIAYFTADIAMVYCGL